MTNYFQNFATILCFIIYVKQIGYYISLAHNKGTHIQHRHVLTQKRVVSTTPMFLSVVSQLGLNWVAFPDNAVS